VRKKRAAKPLADAAPEAQVESAAASADEPGPPDERQADFLWNGRPVYRCRFCPYERVENLATVVEHEAVVHQVVMRASQIVGADGVPLLVEE